METIKVNFGYFWPDFNPEDNYFTRVLSKKYKVELSDHPDLFFFTHAYNGQRDYLHYKCHRVFLGWENERADWRDIDLFDRANFLFFNDVKRRKKSADHRHQNYQDARHHKNLVVHEWVKPIDC